MYDEHLLKRQIENERRKRRMVTYTFLCLSCAYLFFNIFFDDMGFIKYMQLRQTEERLVMEIAALRQENARIEKEIEMLESNPFYIEKHARENLNLAAPDEYIFLYEQ